jgi:hypothetical protein
VSRRKPAFLPRNNNFSPYSCSAFQVYLHTYPQLAASLLPLKTSSAVFSSDSSLFLQNTRGGYPLACTQPTEKDKTMKAQSSRLISSARCEYRTATGRQCSSLAGDRSSGFCPRHAAPKQVSSPDFRAVLTADAQEFQRAQGVNHSLGVLYGLLASGQISPRRASVLAYISSLLLRTLPAIDYDHEYYAAENNDEPEKQQRTELAAAQTAPQPVKRQLSPGKDPLPSTAEGFAAAVLDRKPN